MTFEQLFSQAEYELGKTSKSIEHVGNRPHYPMFLAANAGFDASAWKDVRYSLARMWPQTIKYLVTCRYQMDGDRPSFSSIEAAQPLQVEQIQARLDEAKMQSSVFAEMSEWYLYNLIDTRCISSLDEFKRQYSLIHPLKDIVVDSARGILILLLDDSNAKRTLAEDIRQFLSTDSTYDCRIILSTRDMSNVNHKSEELRRIAGDVIVISNNDAVSNHDDEEFRARRGLFVSGGTYTVSYVIKENPNDRIALQISETLIGYLGKQVSPDRADNKCDIKYWTDLLEIKANRCGLCENFIESVRLDVPQKAFDGLPVRLEVVGEKIDFSTVSYEKFARYTFADVFENFATTYFKSVLSSSLRASDFIDQFKSLIIGHATLSGIKQLDAEMIEQIMSQLRLGAVDPQLPLPRYFEGIMKAFLRKELVYPGMRRALEDLAQDAEKTEEAIRQTQREFGAFKPPVSYADLGTIYKDACDMYVSSADGSKDLRDACAAGNDQEKILAGLYTCFRNMVSQNISLFSMPLVKAWATRLKMAGEAIFKEIGSALVGDQKEHLLLHTTGAVNPQMKVYMLHTTNENGEEPTELYRYLKAAFEMDASAQFLNTGYDDSLEALIFASVEGINLAL